jgi:intergrase/recombinase
MNTTCGFDSSASAKRISDKIYKVRLRGFSSISTKHKIDNNVKNIARTFFSSEIHATDSTWTG